MSKQKKEPFSLMTVKTLLAILLFTGMAVIIIGGGYIIMRYSLFETEEISVTTSKLEYKQGEIVELTIRNSFNKEQGIYFSDPFVEKFNHLKLENNWEPVKQVWCPCQSHCYEEKVSNIIKAKSQSKYQWDQTESYCTNNPAWYNRQMISDQVEPSKYRFRIEVDEIGIIYSNEFIITKEDIDQRKVYKNKEYGFELKYPEDWCQRDNYQGTDIMLLNTDKEIIRGGLRPDDYWLSPYNKRNPKYTDNWVGIGINAYQKPVDFNWDSWMKDNFSAIEKYENLDYSNLNSDLKGIKVVKSIGGISNIFLEGENKIFNIRFFSAFPYDVDDDGLNYFEQVISTFKFIETDISNWQTYRNEEFGFEVKYPEEWTAINPNLINNLVNFGMKDSSGVAVVAVVVLDEKNIQEEIDKRKSETKAIDKNTLITESEVLVNNIKAKQIKLLYQPLGSFPESLETSTYFNYENNLYAIHLSTYKKTEQKAIDIYNSFLSTFKFTD